MMYLFALGNATKHFTFLQIFRDTTMRIVIEFSASQIAVPIPDHQLRIRKGNSQSTHPQA